MQSRLPRVAVIGNGYWGKNLVRVFHELGCLELVCETRECSRREVETKYDVRTSGDFSSVVGHAGVDAVAIAAPAVQHYQMAKEALEGGKDVYVEKPLALRSHEGTELTELANRRGRILMVGHILEYHPAILELKRLIREGDLGRIRYIYSSRLNLGKLRTEENILWSFAPHDISVICTLLGESPEYVASHGGSYLNKEIFDTTMTTCQFGSGVQAHIFVSWLHPFKEQKLAVIGDKRMAVFDDVEPQRKLVLYSHRIDWVDRMPVAFKDEGEVLVLPRSEPLKNECQHFVTCMLERATPRTDGRNGTRVLEILEACEHSLRKNGEPVKLAKIAAIPKYVAHPTAVIDEPCEIGAGTKIWHFSHIMANSRIGRNCNLGQNVVISPDVVIGNNVKIQNNVSIYTGVILEDDVFCGPSMVFTNVINPRSHVVRKHEYKTTLVKRGATFGANSTIVCGATVGEYAFVAAGAVVTKDVPAYAMMMGVPARQVGWVCYCGTRLANDAAQVECAICGRSYSIQGDTCVEVVGSPEMLQEQAAAGDD